MPVRIVSAGGGGITLSAASTGGEFTATLPANTGTVVTTASTATVTPAMLTQPLTLGTAQASTSGTSIDFTGIPSWVRRITILFNGVSTNDASNLLLQIGDAGGIESTGYVGGSFNTGVAANSTAGFDLTAQNIATATWGGSITLTNFGGNTWCEAGVISSSSGGYIGASGGVKTLSDTLDRVRITSVTGAATFDAGSINIMYEG